MFTHQKDFPFQCLLWVVGLSRFAFVHVNRFLEFPKFVELGKIPTFSPTAVHTAGLTLLDPIWAGSVHSNMEENVLVGCVCFLSFPHPHAAHVASFDGIQMEAKSWPIHLDPIRAGSVHDGMGKGRTTQPPTDAFLHLPAPPRKLPDWMGSRWISHDLSNSPQWWDSLWNQFLGGGGWGKHRSGS